jgi:hypothetical protein
MHMQSTAHAWGSIQATGANARRRSLESEKHEIVAIPVPSLNDLTCKVTYHRII